MASAFAREIAADLFVKAGDAERAAAALAPAIAWWRKVRATWYLARVVAWAGERGISVAPSA